MLQKLLTLAANPALEPDLFAEVDSFVDAMRASADRYEAALVRRTEDAVRLDPRRAFAFDDAGRATLSAEGYTWQAGRFETPSLAELRQCAAGAASAGPARLWVFDGASPATDIGSLQATAGAGELFQVASQFNCLEAASAQVVPVAWYFSDPTQGPRASISAFPATLLRHYAAPGPGGERFVQENHGRQIDLLADVFGPGRSPVRNGYLQGDGGLGPTAFVAALEAGLERARVGVHDGAQVVFGHNWTGAVEGSESRRITQVFTSTLAGGMYGAHRNLGPEFAPACRQTLRAAYLGTLLAAVALKRSPVVLTLIGGGVFDNPIGLIWASILWAFDEVKPLASGPFEVVVNGYNLAGQISLAQILPGVRERGGALLRFGHEGLREVMR